MRKWIEEILSADKRIAIPIMTHPGIELINRRVIDAATDGDVHFEAIKAVSEAYNTAACTVIMDLTVEAEAFGSQIAFSTDELPNVVNRLVCDEASVELLATPDLSKGRLPEYLKANRRAVLELERPVLSGCIGPFSLAGRLYDMSEIMMGIYIEPDVIHRLLDKCTRFLMTYCRALKEAGVQGVIMAEPAAGLLSNEDCMSYSTAYVEQVVREVQDADFSIILHNCGNKGQCTQAMIASGAAALHFGNAIDLPRALEECPEHLLILGNIDPVSILKQSTPEKVFRATTDLLNQTKRFSNFVLSSGCDMPPQTPPENIQAFYRALDAFNATL